METFYPQSSGTKRVSLLAIILHPPSERAEEMQHHLIKAEELMSKYELPAGKRQGECLGVTAIIGWRVKDLNEGPELAANYMMCLRHLWRVTPHGRGQERSGRASRVEICWQDVFLS